MSAPNGTLEDCQTNVYALTELYGLNWCSLTTPQNYQYGNDVEQDPVLKAYGECLNEGLLCVWRRRPPQDSTVQTHANPFFKLDAPKELWVFWYTQDQPTRLETLTQSGLTYSESPTDLSTNGLNYETRVLFFNALHNTFERFFLKNGFVRFGKWFTRPLEAPVADMDCSIPQYIDAVKFNFFIAGDNHVCMTVTEQRQPPLLKLSPAHLSSSKKIPVVLGPWSLQAFLLPNQPMVFQNSEVLKDSLASSLNYASMVLDEKSKSSSTNPNLKEVQATVTKVWNDWKKFLALPVDGYEDISEEFTPSESGKIPKMVWAEIDGVKMFYPSCFVGVLVEEEKPKAEVKRTEMPDPLCEEDQEVEQILATASKKKSKSVVKAPGCMRYWRKSYAGVRSARRLLEDACLNSMPPNKLPLEDDARWNFFDYLKRYYCYCRNCSTAAALQEDQMFPFTAPTPVEGPGPSSYAMHRSPPLLEALTPEHSPNFLEDMRHDPDKDPDAPFWSTQIKRRDTVGKRLTTKEQPRVEVFDVLKPHVSQEFNENAMRHRPFTPFTPITSVSPEPDLEYKTPAFQETIRSFEYKFNPLKRDHLKPESYHKSTKKPLGPDRDRDSFYYLNDDEASRTPNPQEPSNMSSGMNDYPMNEFQENFSLPTEFYPSTGSAFAHEFPFSDRLNDPVYTNRNKREKKEKNTKKKSRWPSLEVLDVMHHAVMECEEAQPCVFTKELEPRIEGIHIEPEKDPLDDLWNEREVQEPIPSTSEPQEMEQTIPYGEADQYFMSNDAFEMTQCPTSIPNAMEATPPSFQHPFTSDANGDSTILSPPASNESHAAASINAAGGIHYIAGPASHPGSMHESLSIIYPTPPTPMQQFSPQNHLIPPVLIPEHSWQPASVASMETNENDKNRPLDAEILLSKMATSPIYKETSDVKAPNGDDFTDLFEEANFDQKLQNANKELKSSLKTRIERQKIRNPPHYMTNMALVKKDLYSTVRDDPLAGLCLVKDQFPPLGGGLGPSGPLEQLGSMIPPDVRMSQPSTSGLNMPFGMNSQAGMVGQQGFNRPPFGPGSQGGFPMRHGMMGQNQNMMPGMFPNSMDSSGMFGQSSMGMQSGMGMQNRHQFMFPGSGFDSMGNMGGGMGHSSMSNMPRPGFQGGAQPNFQNQQQQQQSMMFRGMSSGASVLPISSPMSNPSFGPNTPINQNTGSPMPPPPYNSFGSPAINSIRADHQIQPQRTASNPSLVNPNNAVLPMNNNFATTTTASENPSNFGGSGSALFNTLQLKEVSAILQDGKSCVISLLLQDSVLNLHYDAVFDACPICSCNTNIRGYELGIYIRVPEQLFINDRLQQQLQNNARFMTDLWNGFTITGNNPPSRCSCGFSAVRHRYLSGVGLFPSDIREATGLEPSFPRKTVPKSIWFDQNSKNDFKFLDLMRHLSQTRDLASLIMQTEYIGEINRVTIENKSIDFTGPTDYIVSRVDSEINDVFSSVIDLAIASSNASSATSITRPSKTNKKSILHPWGVQMANGILEPKEPECVGIIREIQPFIEEAIRLVRHTKSTNNIVEGPLSWRDFHGKASKTTARSQQGDEGHLPEKIPNVIVATERESVLATPQLLHCWEKLSLGPYDQPKDVLYMAVVPDSNVVIEKSKIFLEELSKVYEKCRFGRHVRILTKETIRDGMIRINYKSNGGHLDPDLERIFKLKGSSDKKLLLSRLKAYVENCISELYAFFKTNDAIFDRKMYYETLCRDGHQQNYTSLATSSDSNSMPPPAMPVQSPSSVLSSTSGPSSLGPLQQSPVAPGQPSPMGHSNMNPAMMSNPNLASLISGTEPLTPESQIGTPNSQQDHATSVTTEANIDMEVQRLMADENPSILPHVIVIYLINPFSFGGDAQENHMSRLAIVSLMRAFNSFLHKLDLTRRPQVQLELINLQSIYDYSGFVSDALRESTQLLDPVEYSSVNDKMSAQDALRKVAFSVYTQTRVVLAENVRNIIPKSMTKFGPASSLKDILDGMKGGPTTLYKIPSAPFILASQRSIASVSTVGTTNKVQVTNPDEKVLFVSYCLIDDEWLCAAVTDESGHLSDNVLINLTTNIDHKSMYKHKNRSQIYDALSRLWVYIQGVLSLGTKNWRVVIGRLGRMGHGEFKIWTQLLSKKSLKAYNSSLKGRDKDVTTPGPNAMGPSTSGCKTCATVPGYQEIPAILSACLITTEPEPNLRVFPTLPTVGEAATTTTKSGKGKLPNVLDDPSITHIMVFPTSPNLQSSEQQGAGMAEDDNDLFNLFTDTGHQIPDEDNMFDNLLDDNMLFGNMDTGTENVIDNQPMATGYVVSLAPASDLPDWFWAACPSVKRRLPVHLKSSLHINAANIQQNDEIIGSKSAGSEFHHPLDSTSTDEVLRYVLETYNSLSWLNIDLTTGTRRSCLPIHIQALLRLYRSVNTVFS